MDTLELSRRLTRARELAGMTQESLGRAVGLDRTAVTRLEKGERKLSVPELVSIADALGRPLAYFVAEPVPAAVSRRADLATAEVSTQALDMELEQFASDVRTLLDMRLLDASERAEEAHTPRSHPAAERMAESVRRQLDLGSGPIADLGLACEQLGLYTYSARLGTAGPDGGCLEVATDRGVVGAAVINGDAPAGRRRMTLAHELAHWLSGDAYDSEAAIDSERMINSLAIHFLAPRSGVIAIWNQNVHWSTRDRALAISASFRLSWSAALTQLRNVGLIGHDDFETLSRSEPRSGDFLRLGRGWVEELAGPYVSPRFAAAAVNGFVAGRITADRATELLRGTIAKDDLPVASPSLDDLTRSFLGHDG